MRSRLAASSSVPDPARYWRGLHDCVHRSFNFKGNRGATSRWGRRRPSQREMSAEIGLPMPKPPTMLPERQKTFDSHRQPVQQRHPPPYPTPPPPPPPTPPPLPPLPKQETLPSLHNDRAVKMSEFKHEKAPKQSSTPQRPLTSGLRFPTNAVAQNGGKMNVTHRQRAKFRRRSSRRTSQSARAAIDSRQPARLVLLTAVRRKIT